MAPESRSILLISMCGPEHFAGLGADIINALEQNGHKVDYLTKYASRHPNVIGVYPANQQPLAQRIRLRYPFLSFLRPVIRLFRNGKQPVIPYRYKNGLTLVSPDEEQPPVDIDLILSKIQPTYDMVLVHVWQDMLTSKTLKAIYDSLHVPIILLAADMQPLTGGCFYFGDCRNFTHGCGNCPILDSTDPDDVTHANHAFKQGVYTSINCAFAGNTYMNRFATQSGLFTNEQIKMVSMVLDKNIFKTLDQMASRKALGIPPGKTHILLSRFAGNKHTLKGNDYLVESINRLAERLDAGQKAKTLLVFAGNHDADYENRFNLDVKNIGFLTRDELIQAYSAATVFISSSIDDAGPSMVNQSLMCGTPVVAYEVGTAIDAVINDVTGQKAPLKDTEAFAEGIRRILELPTANYLTMRKNCRTFAEEHYSFSAFADTITDIYENINQPYRS